MRESLWCEVVPPRSSPPPEWFRAYRSDNAYVDVYAPWGVHLLLRAWYYRWRPVAWLVGYGVMTCREGDYLRHARFAPFNRWFQGRRSGS